MFFLDFVLNNGWVGVKIPKLFSENAHQLVVLQTCRTVLKHIMHNKWGGHIWPLHDAMGGWGSRVLDKHMKFCLKKVHQTEAKEPLID